MLGVASAERRLAQDTAHAARAQEQLAASARKAHTELKAAAAAFRLASTGRGINPLTGGAMERPGVGAITGINRAQLLYSIQRRGLSDFSEHGPAGERSMLGGVSYGQRVANWATQYKSDKVLERIGEGIGKVFGPRFAHIGRVAGSHADGRISGSMVAFGAATLGATALLGAFRSALQVVIDSSRRVAEGQEDLARKTREYIAAADSAAIGEAKKNQNAIASLIGSNRFEQAQADAKGLGADGLQAIGVLNQRGLYNNKNIEAIRKVQETGQMSALQAATTLGGARGLAAAKTSTLEAQAILGRGGIYNVDVGKSATLYGASAFGKAMNRNDATEEGQSRNLLGRFASGQTIVTANEEKFKTDHPRLAALKETGRDLDEQEAIQKRVVAHMGWFMRFMDHMWNTFNGYEQSEDVKLRRMGREKGEITNAHITNGQAGP